MNRAQAYELAKARGFNKSISAFGGQFTRNPQAVVCGIKRIDRGVFVEVEEDSVTDSINNNTNSVDPLPLNGKNSLAEDSQQQEALTETPQPENPSVEALSTEEKSPQEDSPEQEALTETPQPENPSVEALSTEEKSPQEDSPEPDNPSVKPIVNKEKPLAEDSSQSENSSPKSSSKNQDSNGKKDYQQQSDRPPRIRRKLYTANGTHQAICRFQGVLMPRPEGEKGFRLLLPGLEVEAHFAFPKTLWFYRQNPHLFEGVRNYLGYPKVTGEGKLVKIQIVAIEQEQSFQKEQWEFIGMWCGPQKALFVQRQGQMFPDEERPHYYKYRFKNQDEYRKYLWDRYAYHIIAKREGDELLIVRNNPFACPRRKPEPPTRGRPPSRNPSASGFAAGKPQVKSLPTLKS
ncbi:hypothetical protein PCC7424_3367 [Gloeothece citriformis PCC 7424]|uniref:Uncharacterized protein n=1 Tax=Gloeothece citriformis (strain PCC 7424) TaxID=65393 RepID=B7KE65_GLOC7|nr:hypothetical protein [Gloeothece citriformis]ACK71763.1 hypothetical protein PCC7424_3367 [Gloeothece citriformis PCC 7424]